MRAFIAIPTSNNLLAELSEEVAWRTNGDAQKKQKLHLTLAFIPHLSATQLAGLNKTLKDKIQNLTRVELKLLGKIEYWDKVAIQPVTLTNNLAKLRQEIAESLKSCNIAWDDMRPFKPHITLAKHVSAFYSNCPECKLIIEGTEVLLFRSTLTEKGSIYEPLSRYLLNITQEL